MGEKMTEQKVARLKSVADGLRRIQEFESARYLDEYATHLATPAQTVNVDAVRKVIAAIRAVLPRDQGNLVVSYWADLLAQAIGDKT